MGGAIRETGGAKDEIGGADQRKYSIIWIYLIVSRSNGSSYSQLRQH